MSDIIYQNTRYVLHTAAEVTPKPADWDENKAQYAAEVTARLEALAERAQALNEQYAIVPTDDLAKQTPRTTGVALDSIVKRIENTIARVATGSFLITHPIDPKQHIPIFDAPAELERLLNQWEKLAVSSQTVQDTPEGQAVPKKETEGALPKYVETYMARMNEKVADVWATLKRKNEAAADETAKAESEQILGSFANFMEMLKVVSDALANGETIVLSRGTSTEDKIDKDPSKSVFSKLEVERPVKDVVKELWLEFRHYLVEARKQKTQEKEKAKPVKEPKAPKEPKPSNLLEITQELIATIQDIQNKNPQYLLQPKVRDGFNKLKADAVAVGQAVEAGAASVTLSTGDYPIADAVKLIQDGVASYKRMMQKELAPQARDQAKQEKQIGTLADLEANIARVEAEATQLKSRQSTMSNDRLELLQKIKRAANPAAKQALMQQMRQTAQQMNNLRVEIDKLQNERSSLVLARDNLLKKTRPVPVSQPEVTAPAGIVQTPEF